MFFLSCFPVAHSGEGSGCDGGIYLADDSLIRRGGSCRDSDYRHLAHPSTRNSTKNIAQGGHTFQMAKKRMRPHRALAAQCAVGLSRGATKCKSVANLRFAMNIPLGRALRGGAACQAVANFASRSLVGRRCFFGRGAAGGFLILFSVYL